MMKIKKTLTEEELRHNKHLNIIFNKPISIGIYNPDYKSKNHIFSIVNEGIYKYLCEIDLIFKVKRKWYIVELKTCKREGWFMSKKKAEKQLRFSEEYFKNIFKKNPIKLIVIKIKDVKSYIIYEVN